MLTPNQKKRISSWMDDAIRNGTWSNYDDLHIDRINPWIKKRSEKWVEKSIEYFEFANSQIKHLNGFKIVLVIMLASRKKLRDITQINLDTLSGNKLSYSPPSLYLYKDKHLFGRWINKSVKKRHIRYKRFLCFLYQRKDWDDGDYTNCIYITSDQE